VATLDHYPDVAAAKDNHSATVGGRANDAKLRRVDSPVKQRIAGRGRRVSERHEADDDGLEVHQLVGVGQGAADALKARGLYSPVSPVLLGGNISREAWSAMRAKT
jgi:hypothetical protein